MDIAVSALSLLTPLGIDRGRQARPEQARQDKASNSQNSNNRTSSENRSREKDRVIRGEVLSSKTDIIYENTRSTKSTLQNRDSTFGESDKRQLSLKAAIQTFRDTEAIIAAPGEQRQISGIIDEYV